MSSFENVKAGLDIVDVAGGYVELKKVSGNDYLATVNPLRDERTSSLHFFADSQRYFDFGSGESGDVFDFVAKIENISLSEARRRLAGDEVDYKPLPIKRSPPAPKPTISKEQLQKEFDSFERLSFENQDHAKELLSVAPLWLYKQAHKTDLELFQAITRYDRANQTLVCLWAKDTIQGLEAVSYKRRRYMTGKWVNRKDTSPNSTPFIRISFDDKPMYIVEGARDTLTAILLGLNAIGLPSAHYKNMKALEERILRDDKVLCIVEDEPSFICMQRIEQGLKDRAKVELIALSSSGDKKIDLSDLVMSKNSIDEVINEL